MAKLDENFVVLTKDEIDNEVKKFQDQIDELRKDGETKVRELDEKIYLIKRDKGIDKETKEAKLAELTAKLNEAKAVAKEHKEEVKKLMKEAKTFLKPNFKAYYLKEKAANKEKRLGLKADYLEKVNKCKAEYKDTLANFESRKAEFEHNDYAIQLKNLKRTHESALYELKLNYNKAVEKENDALHSEYRHHVHHLQNINGTDLNLVEKAESSLETYCYKFNIKDFLLRNGLYYVMIVGFIICCIAAPIMNRGNLLEIPNLMELLDQASPRIFLALGVAGLILLGGTDLSIGRMVGMGSIITCMLLQGGPNTAPLFGIPGIDFTFMPAGLRVFLALIITIVLCTAFSALAGYFTAKFKMHPFISTLGTQLIIFGLVAVITGANNTGVIDLQIKNAVAGRIGDFPILLIYAIIGIIVVSIIWNKTKFGKNMYAVGGNQEAAAVSGINVFWTTLGVFIMAGILYGFGSFFESVRAGTGKFDTGTGFELDAIAACVVGGISFSGGIGKLKGAVIGAIIFTALTFALTFLGIDPYYQFIVKGIIILFAVTVDSMKYLKKK